MNGPENSWESSVCIKVRIAECASLRPEHLFSEIDEEPLSDPELNNDFLNGTTEWVAAWQGRQLSFGLDWRLQRSKRMMLGCWDTLRTNLIIVDADDVDQGKECLRSCVERILNNVQWEETVMAHLHRDLLH
ncbi:MAG TPA: DUF4902 domain-containing protein [Burkholderiaceae bacterium]|nr:DUF4902 domain-containing protein [Burkholderiaceae bacterium]